MTDTPPNTIRHTVAAVLLALLPAGCDRTEQRAHQRSNAAFLLDLQHQVWRGARETLASDQPDVRKVAVVYSLLADRTARRVRRDYNGGDKAEVLRRLADLAEAYRTGVMSKLNMTGAVPAFKAGVGVAELRSAFMKIDPDYRAFEAMAAGD